MALLKKQQQLNMLIAKKEQYFSRIQKLYESSRLIENEVELNNFRIRYQTLESTKEVFLKTLDDIHILEYELEPKYIPSYQILEAFDEIYCHIQVVAKKVLKENENNSNKAIPRLPKLQIPPFSGNIKEWPVFIECFNSLIHNNKDLNDIDRVHYLIGSLSGSALNVCSGIPPTGDNYRVIYQALVDKFSDKRAMANSYLEQILTFKQPHTETIGSFNMFLDKFDTSVRALQKLNLADLSDYILAYLALSKLNPETQRLFENTYRKSEMPSYQDIVDFVKDQAKICIRTQSTIKPNTTGSSKSKTTHSFLVQNYSPTNKCTFCKASSHTIMVCSKFLEMSPVDRYKFIRNQNLCLNCFGNHKVVDCKSKGRCKTCKLRHHSLLHFQSTNNLPKTTNSLVSNVLNHSVSTAIAEPSTSTGVTGNLQRFETIREQNLDTEQSKTFVNCYSATDSTRVLGNNTVLLSTAKVNVLDSYGNQHEARFLLDSCSQANFLTLEFCKRWKLNISKLYTEVQGIGSSCSRIYGRANIVIFSKIDPTKRYPIEVLVVEKITNQLPLVEVNISSFSHLDGIPLADNNFNKPNKIDGIIGAELYPYLLGPRRIVGPPKSPIAVETSLGYIVMGTAPILPALEITHTFCTILEPSLENLVKRFWEIEDIHVSPATNPDDVECEKIFESTYSRDLSGRYIVALPFQHSYSNLGDSFTMAYRRFLSLEKRLLSNPNLKIQYSEIINDYIAQGHMTKVVENNDVTASYYVPHHPVYKLDSASTPLRIVFDASAKSDSSYSLNDLLYTGPKLQVDVLTMFLNFRLFEIAFIADLRQMYRQILMHPDQRRFQRILWRFSPDDSIATYQLNTVSFGVKSSPFLALRTVRQLASDEGTSFPLAAEVVRRDMYVDDLVSSISTVDQAITLYTELIELFKRGGFDLVKWATNSKQLLNVIPEENRSTQLVNFETDCLKVLGLQWHPELDFLSFSLKFYEKICTKRNILSTIARCFDPLGFLAPFTLLAKLLVKDLWKLRIDWDETPPNDIVQRWNTFQNGLPLLSNFRIPRYLGVANQSSVMLIGFADACETSYGAVVYMRIESLHSVRTSLVCAKSKVSPMKTISIPRLELCSAHLLAKLINFITQAYHTRLNIEKIIALSDSTVTLSWINAPPHKWKTFVANRVSKIQDLIPSNCWYHIDGKNNVSDCLSRGMSPSQFVENRSWISGPPWLQQDISHWPIKSVVSEHCTILEEKKVMLATSNGEIHPLILLAERCSSWFKFLRSIVYVLRFLKLLPRGTVITVDDLEKAETVIIKVVQNSHFPSEIKLLEKDGNCSSSLRSLRPFIHDGILRVGGRFVNSKLNFEGQHPVLLPKRNRVVDLLIDHYHCSNLHTGPNLVLSLLRQRYWILSARGVVRYRIQKCNVCFKVNPKPKFPLLGNLPSCRVQEAKAFLHTGVDFCGPVHILPYRKRGVHSQKRYICLFVCLVTKAIHLELVSDLSTGNFLQAFKRFLSRRGLVTSMYSDCGINFIGAKAYLDELYTLVNSTQFNENLSTELSNRGIKWKLNPPSAPHFGGIWESNVKSVKTHLYRVIGQQLLTFEEMNTLLIQIEALLNSRPLCIFSSDPAEPLALTPAHFLTLTPLRTLPAHDITSENIHRLDRFQMVDRMVQDYWKRWRLEYLTSLQTRQRWTTPVSPIKCGTVVLLEQANIPPLQWPLGIIVETFPGKDGETRVVLVKTKNGSYKRPVTKVCPLPTQ